MSENDAFLRRNYKAVKKAMDYLGNTYDADRDGILSGGQPDALDAKWYGKITWLSLYCGASLRATYECVATLLMMWHGLTYRGLAHTRTVRERYHRSKRNPWNEVDCGSHYARSVASYGLFVGICGFEYHGPKGYLAFSPRLTPESLRVTFASAQGWGTSSRIHTNCEEAPTLETEPARIRSGRAPGS